MTTATQSQTGSFGSGIAQGTGTLGENLRRAWADYRAYRATLSELGALTEKQLGDLGMRRDALRSIARNAVYGI